MKYILQALVDGYTIQSGGTSDCDDHTIWFDLTEKEVLKKLANPKPQKLRVKPDYIKIGNTEVNAPYKTEPPNGTEYNVPALVGDLDAPYRYFWLDQEQDRRNLSRNLCFKTEKDAAMAAKAILELLK